MASFRQFVMNQRQKLLGGGRIALVNRRQVAGPALHEKVF
jgi:hypothetical protein